MLQEKPDTEISQNLLTTPESETDSGSLSYKKDTIFTDLQLREMALAAYEQAIQLAPYEAILHYHKGQVLEQLGRISEAEEAYEKARQLGYFKNMINRPH